jgi:hypothetical protein
LHNFFFSQERSPHLDMAHQIAQPEMVRGRFLAAARRRRFNRPSSERCRADPWARAHRTRCRLYSHCRGDALQAGGKFG